ncbi:MAG: M15 family metallopeptidase [Eubacterium sp.]|nr:M15 family metallopeptidase [Eubacterium sp.]
MKNNKTRLTKKLIRNILLIASFSFTLVGCGDSDDSSIYDVPSIETTEVASEVTTEATTEATTKATTEETTEEDTEATTEETPTDTLDEDSEGLPEAEGFVLVTDVIPDAILEIRYYTDYNFVGEQIDGYEEPVALLTKEAAQALKAANDDLEEQGYCIKIYDAYRPQCAVDDFVDWANDTSDSKMQEYFYPEVNKANLFSEGYIAYHSGHSRGSTVDLTIVDKDTGEDVDMGGTFDYFGQVSHPDYTGITDEQYANRMILRDAMTSHGFKAITTEWWHFSLQNEPYPNTYFNFPVSSDSVGR